MPTARGLLVAGGGLVLCVAGALLGYRGVLLLGALALLAVAGASLSVLAGRPTRAGVRRRVPLARTAPGRAVTVRLTVADAGRGGPCVRSVRKGEEEWAGRTARGVRPAPSRRLRAAAPTWPTPSGRGARRRRCRTPSPPPR